jgi:hypothetical protein
MWRILLLGLGLAACGAAAERRPEAVAAPAAAEPAAVAAASAPGPIPEPPALPPVEFVQVEPAAPPARIPALSIVAPARAQVIPPAKAPATAVKLQAPGWLDAPSGNHLCVALDRQPCRRVVDLGTPLALKDLGGTLEEGQHVLSVVARRGSNELVKPSGRFSAFASTVFFVGRRTAPVWKDGAPIVIVSVQDDGPAPPDGLLVDAYVANADFDKGKYRLHTSISGPGLEAGRGESVASLNPWRLKNARPGEYLVAFSLFRYEATDFKSAAAVEVHFESHAVPGPLSEGRRTFVVRTTP